ALAVRRSDGDRGRLGRHVPPRLRDAAGRPGRVRLGAGQRPPHLLPPLFPRAALAGRAAVRRAHRAAESLMAAEDLARARRSFDATGPLREPSARARTARAASRDRALGVPPARPVPARAGGAQERRPAWAVPRLADRGRRADGDRLPGPRRSPLVRLPAGRTAPWQR